MIDEVRDYAFGKRKAPALTVGKPDLLQLERTFPESGFKLNG
jgi:hypothetical protein